METGTSQHRPTITEAGAKNSSGKTNNRIRGHELAAANEKSEETKERLLVEEPQTKIKTCTRSGDRSGSRNQDAPVQAWTRFRRARFEQKTENEKSRSARAADKIETTAYEAEKQRLRSSPKAKGKMDCPYETQK
jgi:hypothetical protein